MNICVYTLVVVARLNVIQQVAPQGFKWFLSKHVAHSSNYVLSRTYAAAAK